MKTIMLPVQPKYAAFEMNGIKTIEVRKFYIEPPFKVVNYVTKGDKNNIFWQSKLYRYIDDRSHNLYDYPLNGKVAFEYVVNKVDEIPPCKAHNGIHYPLISRPELGKLVEMARLTHYELFDYGVKKHNGCYGANSKVVKLYAFHISDLKIYDKPKELREFITKCKYYDPWYMISACSDSDCPYLKIKYGDNGKEMWCGRNGEKAITKPPQNFVYCEVVE